MHHHVSALLSLETFACTTLRKDIWAARKYALFLQQDKELSINILLSLQPDY